MDSWQSPHGRLLPATGTRTLIMGVLNVTPDSFSDGGQLVSLQAVVDRAGTMLHDGADVLDLGGESTRPGARPVPAEEELARVLPAIEAVRRAFPEVPLSIDTYKAEVADAAIAAGADLLNDIWGLLHGAPAETRAAWREVARKSLGSESAHPCTILAPSWRDPLGTSGAGPEEAESSGADAPLTPMAEVAARRRCPVVLMHNRPDRAYDDFWTDLRLDLGASVALARAAGVARHQLWLDPGFGFAKNPPHNLEVLRELRRIAALGYPVLVGTSRKSTLGLVLGTGVDDRIEAGGATVVWAIQQGAAMVRVHDVREMARFARMADAIKAGLDFKPL